jgi:hypothetical protein
VEEEENEKLPPIMATWWEVEIFVQNAPAKTAGPGAGGEGGRALEVALWRVNKVPILR